MNPQDDDEAVGYKCPPKKSRFKKGCSGNPGGSSKKQREAALVRYTHGSVAETFGRIADEKVTVTRNGKAVKITTLEAIVRKGLADGMRPGARVPHWVIKAMADAARAKADAQMELIQYYLDYQRNGRAEIAEAEMFGRSAPRILPHPDDLIIDFLSGTVRCEGPWDEEGLAAVESAMQLRDAHAESAAFFRHDYQRARSAPARQRLHEEMQRAMRYASRLNNALPRRYKVELGDLIFPALHGHR